MSIVALASAKGSPGVTTLAQLLALALAKGTSPDHHDSATERPVLLVDADPAGGDLAARRGLPGTPGLATLALRARRSFVPADVLTHCQTIAGAVQALVGVAGREQSAALEPVLGRIVEALAGLPHVVIIDVGRIDVSSPVLLELLSSAQTLALVTRATTEALLHTRSTCESLLIHGIVPELVLVGRGRHRPREVAEAVGAGIIGTIVDAPGDAAISYRGLPDPKGPLSRSAQALAGVVMSRVVDPGASAGDAVAPSGRPPATGARKRDANGTRWSDAVARWTRGRPAGSSVALP
jgi:MinD-like ATPase involved in chromosome partitioning or flagellar assembly